jgi:hypothetical protein
MFPERTLYRSATVDSVTRYTLRRHTAECNEIQLTDVNRALWSAKGYHFSLNDSHADAHDVQALRSM